MSCKETIKFKVRVSSGGKRCRHIIGKTRTMLSGCRTNHERHRSSFKTSIIPHTSNKISENLTESVHNFNEALPIQETVREATRRMFPLPLIRCENKKKKKRKKKGDGNTIAIFSSLSLLLLIMSQTAFVNVRSSATDDDDFDSNNLPNGTVCHLNQATPNDFVAFEPSTAQFYNQLIQASQNTVLLRDRNNSTDAIKTQTAFHSICKGWINILPIPKSKPTAMWTLDQARGALVAKFIFYNRHEYFDISSREASLVSPIFSPIPDYHSMPDSPYNSSCKISFRSYITIEAHLYLTLFQVPSKASSSLLSSTAATSTRSVQQQSHQPDSASSSSASSQGETIPATSEQTTGRISLIKLMNGKKPPGQQSAARYGEKAAWQDHVVSLPKGLNQHAFYWLEFSAQSGTISEASLGQYKHLNGVAIANFSLTPQCFGLKVDEAELERVKALTGRDPRAHTLQMPNDYSREKYPLPGHNHQLPFYNLLVNFVETYKTLIFVAVIIILLLVVFSTQYLLYAYHQHQLIETSDQEKQQIKPTPLWQRICCCWCFLIANKRRRVYASDNRFGNNRLKMLEEKRNGLYALKKTNENVELSEVNPIYFAQKSATIPLEPYQIDRNRLTLTEPIGKGAFGEVYKGYMVCTCDEDAADYDNFQGDDDNNNIVGRSNSNISNKIIKPQTKRRFESTNATDEWEDSNTHSHTVAVKTLTDERMSRDDFIQEAHNMSQVNHRNIVKLLAVCIEELCCQSPSEKPLLIVMELMPGGNLKNFLLKNRDKGFYQSQTPTNTHQLVAAQQAARESSWNMSCNNINCAVQSPTPSLPVQAQTPQLPPPTLTHSQQQYLNQSPSNQQERVNLCMGDLLVFALDIARACDYLQKRRFIHRDLAARNCLLTSSTKAIVSPGSCSPSPSPATLNGRNFVGTLPSAIDVDANNKVDLEQVFLNGYMNSSIVAKLGDFGMTRGVNSNDYYRTGHKDMPVRWMPPECLDGIATTKSDVWSFGIFLWELFSMGQMPYQNLQNNNEVIAFIKSRRHGRRKTKITHNNGGQHEERPLLVTISDENVAVNVNVEQASTQETTMADYVNAFSNQPLIGDSNLNRASDFSHQATNQVAPKEREREQIQGREIEEEDEEEEEETEIDDSPPLPPPHDNTPISIYAIMRACWANNPEDRPQFDEIAEQLYCCLQMPSVLNTSLPCFTDRNSGRTLRSESRSGATQATQLSWWAL